jgi:hypothetical protein
VSVDVAARKVVLREEGEEPQTYTLGKEARNLDQLKPGDKVKVDYRESVSVRIVPKGEEVKDEDVKTIDRSEPGEKPGGVATRKRSVSGTVSSIFPNTREFLTRNSDGKLKTWKVNDAKDLEHLKSGDRVQLTYTSSMAVNVTPAKPTTTTGPSTAPAKAPAAAPTTP